MQTVIRLTVALAPLLLSFLFAWFVMESDFFGSEKDIFLAVPLLLWSLVFLAACVILWWRKFPFGRLLSASVVVATGFVVVVWVVLFAASW